MITKADRFCLDNLSFKLTLKDDFRVTLQCRQSRLPTIKLPLFVCVGIILLMASQVMLSAQSG